MHVSPHPVTLLSTAAAGQACEGLVSFSLSWKAYSWSWEDEQEMMMEKRCAIPFTMLVMTAAMPFTIDISTFPMVRNTSFTLLRWAVSKVVAVGGTGVRGRRRLRKKKWRLRSRMKIR
jgi:hypothetical protein